MTGLRDILMESGVSQVTDEGFVIVTAVGDDGTRTPGQMSPDEVRVHALALLECAEAAESDAIVLSELQHGAGLDFDMAGAFVRGLRKRRSYEKGKST